MHKITLLVLMFASLVFAACSPTVSVTPTAVSTQTLEFTSPFGTYRVNAPVGWRVTEPEGGLTALMSANNDIFINVYMVDPLTKLLDTYTNPRPMTAASGRQITVYSPPVGLDMEGGSHGITFNMGDSLNILVPIGGTSYLVGVSRIPTRTIDEATLQQIVDMLGTMEIGL